MRIIHARGEQVLVVLLLLDLLGLVDVKRVERHQALDPRQRIENVLLLIIVLKQKVLKALVDLCLGHYRTNRWLQKHTGKV